MTANIDNNLPVKADPIIRTSNGDYSLETDSKTTEYKTYTYRWVVLVLFFLVGHNESVLFSSFSYLSEPLNVLYGVPTNLNTILFTMMCYALFFIGAGPALYVATWESNLYYSVNAASWLMFIGQIMRFCQPEGSCGLMVAGSWIAYLNAPFLLGSFTQFSKNWFPTRERGLATAVCVLGNQLGMITPTLLQRLVPDDTTDKDALREGMLHFNIVILILTGVSALATLLLFRTRAPTPPSPETASRDVSFVTSMRACFTNWRFLCVAISFGISGAWLWDVAMLTPAVLGSNPGYSSVQVANAETIMTVLTIPGIFVAGWWLDKSRDFFWTPITLLALGLGAYMSTFLLSFAPYSTVNYIFVILTACLFTFCLGGAETILLELGAELSYPAREQHSGLIMYCVSQLAGVFQMVTDANADLVFHGDEHASGWLWISVLALALVLLAVTYGGQLNRSAAEDQKKKLTDVRPRLLTAEEGGGEEEEEEISSSSSGKWRDNEKKMMMTNPLLLLWSFSQQIIS